MSSIEEVDLRVRYFETDQMGIVHHAQYLVWFELARTEYLRNRGYQYRELEEKGFRLVVIAVELKYKAPARYDEKIRIKTRVSFHKRLKIEFFYEVYSENGHLIAEGRTMLGSIDAEGKPKIMPEAILAALAR